MATQMNKYTNDLEKSTTIESISVNVFQFGVGRQTLLIIIKIQKELGKQISSPKIGG